jgi:hypothetical protein
MKLRGITIAQLRARTLKFAARLRAFQKDADEGRNEMLDKTLPGWSREEQGKAFRQMSKDLRHHHDDTQGDFKAQYLAEALALQEEIMARLDMRVPPEHPLAPLRYDAADYLEELARQLPP